MTPSAYEKLFAQIIQGIRSSDDRLKNLPIGSGAKNRISGSSGYKHQIDVSFDYDGHLYIVECKRWKSKIGVAEILVLASRRQDIESAHPGPPVFAIIVSQLSATRGASQLARHYGIEISSAKSAHEYGLRLGSSIFLAAGESVGVSDSVTVNVSNKHDRADRQGSRE